MKDKELKEIVKKIPENKKNEASLIVEELKFILLTSNDLKKQINETGCIEHFEQGKQNFLRENPALKSYVALMKTYDTYLKALFQLIPKEESINESFSLEDDDLE